MNVKEALTGAKALVERHWHQGNNTDGHGNYCLRAAIGIASGHMADFGGQVTFVSLPPDPLPYEMADHHRLYVIDTKAADLVLHSLPEKFGAISLFNDHPDTTRNDVLAVLDKAISLC